VIARRRDRLDGERIARPKSVVTVTPFPASPGVPATTPIPMSR